MTPANIAGLAKLAGAELIAVTDHNAADNLPAVQCCCNAYGLRLLPGVEVNTAEEIHVLCYFKTVDTALEFGRLLYAALPEFPYDPAVWGRELVMDESGEVLAVAAGESGEVLLLSARSLALLRRLPMPGIVLDVALRAGAVYALCLNETLNSTLVTIPRAGARQVLSLSGMPGRIACERGDVICATEGFLHTVSMDGMRLLDTRRVSGRASIWLTAGETLLLCDALSECIFARNGGGQWSLFCEHARDMRFLFGKG